MKLYNLIEEFIQYKQSLGMRYRSDAVILRAFCKALGNIAIEDVEPSAVARYLAGKGKLTSFYHRKYTTLNAFYRFSISREYVTSSPLPVTTPKLPQPFVPYIYSKEEFLKLLKATEILDKGNYHLDTFTFHTLLLVLFNTGIRIGEALSLTIADVDLASDLLTIRASKFYKTRLVPIDPRLTTTLRNYRHRQTSVMNSLDFPFFVKKNGEPLNHNIVGRTFRKLCEIARIVRNDRARYQPRLHDARHTFATTRILEWYREGKDVQRLLHYLSTYLGHINISATQRYLTTTAELLHEANRRFENYALGETYND